MVDGLTGLFVRRYFDARIEEEIERSQALRHAVLGRDDGRRRFQEAQRHLRASRRRPCAARDRERRQGADARRRHRGALRRRGDRRDPAAHRDGRRVQRRRAHPRGDRRAAHHDRRAIRRACSAVTASLGIAAYPESKAADGEDLVRRADRALYRAKKTGKNRVELFWSDESGPARADRRRRCVSDERKAAERKVGFARLWARAKQIVTTDPTGSDEDDHVVDEEAARVLAAQAGRLKGGLAKVAQLAAYDPGATLGAAAERRAAARAVLGGLWDQRARGRRPARSRSVDRARPRQAAAGAVRALGSRRRSRPRRSARSTPRRCTTAPRSSSRSSIPASPTRCARISTTRASCASSPAPRSARTLDDAALAALARCGARRARLPRARPPRRRSSPRRGPSTRPCCGSRA